MDFTADTAKSFALRIVAIRTKAKEDERAVIDEAMQRASGAEKSAIAIAMFIDDLADNIEQVANAQEELDDALKSFASLDLDGCGEPDCEACNPVEQGKVH